MTTLIVIIYTLYAILNYLANHEMTDASKFQRLWTFILGFFCTPFALWLVIRAVLWPGPFYLNLQTFVQDPEFEKNAYLFSGIVNGILIYALWV